jgi:hypothetical protein
LDTKTTKITKKKIGCELGRRLAWTLFVVFAVFESEGGGARWRGPLGAYAFRALSVFSVAQNGTAAPH